MNKLYIALFLLPVLYGCSIQPATLPTRAKITPIKVVVTEDTITVDAHNVRFENLINSIYAALEIIQEDTVLEFENGMADREVSMQYSGDRSFCFLCRTLQESGHCRIVWDQSQHWTFKDETPHQESIE